MFQCTKDLYPQNRKYCGNCHSNLNDYLIYTERQQFTYQTRPPRLRLYKVIISRAVTHGLGKRFGVIIWLWIPKGSKAEYFMEREESEK